MLEKDCNKKVDVVVPEYQDSCTKADVRRKEIRFI